ncbi:MAG: hypothetical protein WC082_13955 [Victivallales bacterium]
MEPEKLINALIFAVEQCAELGMDKKAAAQKINVSIAEFEQLMEELPRVREAFEKGRDLAPEKQAEAALLKRALGFKQKEIYSEDLIDKKTGEPVETLKRRVVSKEIAPDVRALLFWLKNRCPERWSEKQNGDDYDLELDEDEKDL